VFLLIAVRTLTFEPLAVIAAGLTAAAGWAVMGAYAVEYTPEPAVTRDFVAYITGNMVLIGAEVEKIVAILLVTGVLTLAIVRGRRQVVLAASETTARDHLSRFFAPEVAARITGDDEKVLKPGYGEVRRGAILISDLRNFTAFAAQRPPNEVMAVLVAYQRHVSHIVTEHGGAIDKFLGDGILATFGCARPSSTPARDAVQALMALLETSDGLARGMVGNKPETLGVGFAVTSGDVLCGTVGEESRLEFTVIGEPVNLAAKLEKANKGFDTVALADAALLVEAQREGLDISRLLPHEDLEVVLPGVPNARRVVAWKRQAPERE
jgi:adenylate cyclase